MSRNYKLNMTRPEFMKQIMTDCNPNREITEDDFVSYINKDRLLSYCCYTVLMESDLSVNDIKHIHDDGETVVVKLRSKDQAKRAKELNNKEELRFGRKVYKLTVKVEKDCVIVYATLDREIPAPD